MPNQAKMLLPCIWSSGVPPAADRFGGAAPVSLLSPTDSLVPRLKRVSVVAGLVWTVCIVFTFQCPIQYTTTHREAASWGRSVAVVAAESYARVVTGPVVKGRPRGALA